MNINAYNVYNCEFDLLLPPHSDSVKLFPQQFTNKCWIIPAKMENSENMSDPESCRMGHEETEEQRGWCLFWIDYVEEHLRL